MLLINNMDDQKKHSTLFATTIIIFIFYIFYSIGGWLFRYQYADFYASLDLGVIYLMWLVYFAIFFIIVSSILLIISNKEKKIRILLIIVIMLTLAPIYANAIKTQRLKTVSVAKLYTCNSDLDCTSGEFYDPKSTEGNQVELGCANEKYILRSGWGELYQCKCINYRCCEIRNLIWIESNKSFGHSGLDCK